MWQGLVGCRLVRSGLAGLARRVIVLCGRVWLGRRGGGRYSPEWSGLVLQVRWGRLMSGGLG